MIITVTERGNFRRCKRLWDYTSFNRMGLTAVRHQSALALGTLVHKSLESWLRDSTCDPQEAFVGHAADMMEKAEENYRVVVGARMSESEKSGMYTDMTLGHNMVGNYVAKWKSPLPDKFTLLEPEQTCIIDIPGVRDNWLCSCGHRWWCSTGDREDRVVCPKCAQTFPHGVATVTREKAQLEGTLDGLVASAKGELYVLEHKTYGNRPRLEVLQMNDQFLAYVWILTKLFPERKIGGLLYDGLWKRDNKPIEECFMRHLIDRPPYEVENFETQLRAEYIDMLNTDVAYPNRNWMGCTDCKAFNSLCTAESRGEDMQWLLEENYTFREKSMVTDDGDD